MAYAVWQQCFLNDTSSFSRTAGTRPCEFRANSSFLVRTRSCARKRLVIEPMPPKSLLVLLATLAPIDDEFPPIPDPHPEPFEL